MNRGLPLAFSYLILVQLVCQCTAATSGTASATRPAIELGARKRLPPDAVRRLAARPTRVSMLNSLLEDPNTKSAMAMFAAKRGISESELTTFATKSFQETSVTPVTQVRDQLKRADEVAYQSLDWTSGMTFCPYSVPTYYNGKYHVGDYVITNGTVITSSPDLIDIQFDPPTPNDRVQQGLLALDMELPYGQAMYMVALKLAKDDGECPANMVGGNLGGATSAYVAEMSYIAENRQVQTPVQFSRMTDGSGYVGVVSVDIKPTSIKWGWHPTMRKTTAILTIRYIPANAVADSANRIVFGGITVTRL